MTKIDAVSFSWAGDKYLGRPYSEMDCQKFVEKCMSDCGLHKDLAGSNAWYREVMKHGWIECVCLQTGKDFAVGRDCEVILVKVKVEVEHGS